MALLGPVNTNQKQRYRAEVVKRHFIKLKKLLKIK